MRPVVMTTKTISNRPHVRVSTLEALTVTADEIAQKAGIRQKSAAARGDADRTFIPAGYPYPDPPPHLPLWDSQGPGHRRDQC